MTATAAPDVAVSQQGHYAGAVSRFAAFVVDQFAAGVLFGVGIWFLKLVVSTVVRHDLDLPGHRWILFGVYLVWLFVWFAYPWSISGKSLGMTLFGLRVVKADGAPIDPKRACLRTLMLPVGFLTLGIGFLGIIFGREHRAFHDRIAGSAVVYDWDARSARYHFLARQSEHR